MAETQAGVSDGGEARNILVAVDAREGSRVAFKWAIDNLVREGDIVVLVNARPPKTQFIPTGTDTSASTSSDGDNDEGYMLAIGNIMDDLTKLAHEKRKVRVDRVVKSGDPKHVLVDEVTIRDASALVMSSRGLSPVQRAFLGSVSDYCSRHADCPVIIIRGKPISI